MYSVKKFDITCCILVKLNDYIICKKRGFSNWWSDGSRFKCEVTLDWHLIAILVFFREANEKPTPQRDTSNVCHLYGRCFCIRSAGPRTKAGNKLLILALTFSARVIDGSDFHIIEGAPDEQLHLVDAAIKVEPALVKRSWGVGRAPAMTELE
jgi:hypothetical protein